MDWMELLRPALEQVVALVVVGAAVVGATYLLRWLRARMSAADEELLHELAGRAVEYAEEMGRSGVKGADKLKLAARAFELLTRNRRMSEDEKRARLLAALAELRGVTVDDLSTDERIAAFAAAAVDEILDSANNADNASLAAENAMLRSMIQRAREQAVEEDDDEE